MTPATLHSSRSVTPKFSERRGSIRVQTNDPAELRVIRPFVPGQMHIRILDASQDGLRITTPTPLEPGSLVHVRVRKSAIIAEVRHSSAGPHGFEAGLLVDSLTQLEV